LLLPKPNLDFTFNHAIIEVQQAGADLQDMFGSHFLENCAAQMRHDISANTVTFSILALDDVRSWLETLFLKLQTNLHYTLKVLHAKLPAL
jgi:hypothetical protein